MAAITGTNAVGAIQVASTWGTGVAAGAGDRLAGEFSLSTNTEVLQARAIGSGQVMRANATRGTYRPTITFTGDLGFRNNCDTIIAAFMGTSGAPTEVTASQGDYRHTITVNSTLNAKYVSIGYTDTDSTSIEFPTASVRSIGFSSQSVPGYVDFTAEFLGNQINAPGTTNTYAAITATTFTEGQPELVTTDFTSAFRTNAQSGASIATGNLYSIIGFDCSMTRPQELIPEIKGAAGYSAPAGNGVMEATFNITVKDLADQAYWTIWNAQTAQKGLLEIFGSQIGTGLTKTFRVHFPRLMLADGPSAPLTSDGANPLSLSFTSLVAASNPTGMTSTFPYFQIVNTLSTTLLP